MTCDANSQQILSMFLHSPCETQEFSNNTNFQCSRFFRKTLDNFSEKKPHVIDDFHLIFNNFPCEQCMIHCKTHGPAVQEQGCERRHDQSIDPIVEDKVCMNVEFIHAIFTKKQFRKGSSFQHAREEFGKFCSEIQKWTQSSLHCIALHCIALHCISQISPNHYGNDLSQ